MLNIFRMDGQNLTKFCIHISIDKVWVALVFFLIFATELQPLIDTEIGVCSISFRMDGQNLNKFCIDIFFDKIYVGKMKRHFSQICNRVMALDWCQNWFLLKILIMNVENLTKFCIYITIDMIYSPSVLQTELCSWTYLCPLIVLWRGYGQILWQFQFLQVTRTTIKSRTSSKFDQIRLTMVCRVSCSWTFEKIFYLVENYPK